MSEDQTSALDESLSPYGRVEDQHERGCEQSDYRGRYAQNAYDLERSLILGMLEVWKALDKK